VVDEHEVEGAAGEREAAQLRRVDGRRDADRVGIPGVVTRAAS
jgi:hypothetical protein